ATTRSKSSLLASGRAASWTTTTSASYGTSVRPARTESDRVAPPTVHVTPAGASHVASAGTTTTTPSHAPCATCTARSTTVASPNRANCLAAPKRAPPPAATTIAQVRTTSVSRLLVVEPGEHEATGRGRDDRRD